MLPRTLLVSHRSRSHEDLGENQRLQDLPPKYGLLYTGTNLKNNDHHEQGNDGASALPAGGHASGPADAAPQL